VKAYLAILDTNGSQYIVWIAYPPESRDIAMVCSEWRHFSMKDDHDIVNSLTMYVHPPSLQLDGPVDLDLIYAFFESATYCVVEDLTEFACLVVM
jgi:hypothetical protein